MEKIDFVNAQQPALNDTNLNLMQDYIEMAINAQVSGDTLPVGAVLPYAGATSIPVNWLLCDGREISRAEYPQLYIAIGIRYGDGDGSTTFNLPDFRGRIPVGQDIYQTEFNLVGKTGGEKKHTLTVEEMPAHTHKMPIDSYVDTDAQTNSQRGGHVSSGTAGVQYNTTSAGGGQAHNILQPYITQKYIIKAFQTAGTVAQIVNTHNISSTDAYSASISNGTTLYANSSGTNSTFSLSTSAANYTRLVIHYFETRNNQYSSVEILSPDGKKVALSNFFAGTSTYLNTAVISISGTSVTWETNRRERISDGQQDTDHIIKITDVIGYKY